MSEKNIFDKKITAYNLLNTMLKRWYFTVAIIAVSLIVGIVYAFLYVSPLYSSSAKLYIINKENVNLSSADLAVSTSLAKDFEVIINDESVISEVAKELNYEYTSSQIRSFISVTNPSNTRIIELKAVTFDSQISNQITNSLCTILQEKITDIMGVDRISVISQGNLTVDPAANRQIRTVSYSFIFGVICSLVLGIVLTYTNNKISSSSEVEEILNLKILGTIPYNKTKRTKN